MLSTTEDDTLSKAADQAIEFANRHWTMLVEDRLPTMTKEENMIAKEFRRYFPKISVSSLPRTLLGRDLTQMATFYEKIWEVRTTIH